ncbi:type I-E CRISPR-associated protein Cse2/CasB [Micromonospora sp. NPDC050695]|uniref:type I-E CRISPR-associated protein Cse2/CasB n=1 Tax=Micromonospora sp. NPDC050695 TaxID=3154938 RepID=UPI0033F0B1BD
MTINNSEHQKQQRRRHFWERDFPKTVPEGRDLAALRVGLGRESGSVPAMWPYYTVLHAEGWITPKLRAEHAALALFAVHQQSQPRLMHKPDVGLGWAMANLRRSDKFSPEAVDRRFGAAATATSFTEVVAHLRGLVSQLRTLKPAQPLDYTRLLRDLCDWQDQERVHSVRRRWGSQYFTAGRDGQTPADQDSASAPA